jgi:hypothetical protein
MKIHKQILAIMNECDSIAKGRKNVQQGYMFRGIDDVYQALHPLLAKHGVYSTSEIVDSKREERPSKAGGVLNYTILTIKYTFYADDGSSVSSEVIGEGMDSGDKSANKAMSVAHKYALLQILSIPTADSKDPENENPEPMPRNYATNYATQNTPQSPQRPQQNGKYTVGFGKHKGKTLEEMGEKDVRSYLMYLLGEMNKSGKEPLPSVKAYLDEAKKFLDQNQNNNPPPPSDDLPF